MTLSQTDRVKFLPEEHKYILDGNKELIGVTTLMRRQGLAPDYSMIDEATLQHAADMGTQAHQAIEAYCEGLPVPDIPLLKSFKKLKLDIIATEYLVSDFNVVASSIDLIAKVDDNTVDLIDMKRTSTVHKESVSYQTSIYAYLFEQMNPTIKVRNLYCLPIKKGNVNDINRDKCGELVQLERIDEWDIRTLIDCEATGIMFEKPERIDPTTDLALTFVNGNFPKLVASLRAIKELEAYIDQAKEGLTNFMTEHGVEKVEFEDVTISLKRPYFSQRFDTKAFRKDYPDLADKYTNSTEVAGSITIKLK